MSEKNSSDLFNDDLDDDILFSEEFTSHDEETHDDYLNEDETSHEESEADVEDEIDPDEPVELYDEEDEDEDEELNQLLENSKSKKGSYLLAGVAVAACSGLLFAISTGAFDSSNNDETEFAFDGGNELPETHSLPEDNAPIPSNNIATEDEINNPQENGIEIELPFDADTETEQQIENVADSEFTSNASDEITAPENQPVMTPPTQEELIAIAKNEIIEQLMSSIESAKIDTQHFVASTISNNINSILLEKQNQDLIDYNAINTAISEAITSNLNSDKTKHDEGQAETQRMLEAVATQIKNSESNTNSNLEKINQSLSAHSKDEAKIASNIEAIKKATAKPKIEQYDLKDRKRLGNINVVNFTQDGKMSIVKTPTKNINTFFVGESFTYNGQKLTVTGIVNGGRVILIDDNKFIDEKRVKVKHTKPKPAKKPIAEKAKTKAKEPEYIMLPSSPSETLNHAPGNAYVPNKGTDSQLIRISDWKVNSIFPSGFLISDSAGNTRIVKKGQIVNIGGYKGEVFGINEVYNGLQIGNAILEMI